MSENASNCAVISTLLMSRTGVPIISISFFFTAKEIVEANKHRISFINEYIWFSL